MTKIKFGTDGWRSLVAEDFTLPNVRVVTQGVASYLKRHPAAGRAKAVIVGYDTRPLGDRFAEAAAEVFAGNGFRVLLTRTPTPTPAISFAIRELALQGGIAVTASHNPFTYNGLKFKPAYAGPAEPEMTRWIEGRLFRE
ncbi:MAG: phosphoglucomutase/phosphomannomutase family protein, partial [Candidatus Omnitrophica bacterium]|nr:phosphoglucomutase/phosphomannomutase family protein [Candidatus Omnitrophota bacterium]